MDEEMNPFLDSIEDWEDMTMLTELGLQLAKMVDSIEKKDETDHHEEAIKMFAQRLIQYLQEAIETRMKEPLPAYAKTERKYIMHHLNLDTEKKVEKILYMQQARKMFPDMPIKTLLEYVEESFETEIPGF